MTTISEIQQALQTKQGYLKFYLSQTAYFLEGGYVIDLPIDGFRQFVFTQVLFIEQGETTPSCDNPYGDAILVNSGDAAAYSDMVVTQIAAIKSHL